jgi:peptidase M23-like protein
MAFPDDEGAFPLPALDTGGQIRYPTVSNGYADAHDGVDAAYYAAKGDPPYEGHYTATRTPGYYMPAGRPVLAAGEGDVWLVGEDSHGKFVRLEHGEHGAWNTYYRHLARVDVKRGDKVRAGQVIGIAGADPSEGASGFNHVHFELEDWRDGTGRKVDPEPYMRAWPVYLDTGSADRFIAERWGDTDAGQRRNTYSATKRKPKQPTKDGGSSAWVLAIVLLLVAKNAKF